MDPHDSSGSSGTVQAAVTNLLATAVSCLVEETEAHVLVGLLLLCDRNVSADQ